MLSSFFIRCSGADTNILNECALGEQTKYAGIGATVFFTAVMAFISSGFALFTVFNNLYIAIGFGLIWALMIFNLDRYIVATLKKSGSFRSEIGQAIPRLLLAFLIALVISKPLEIKIFEKEIATVLLQEKNKMQLTNQKEISAYFDKDAAKIKAAIQSLQQERTAKEKEVQQLYTTFIAEAEGTAGTKKLGKGPVYKEKRAKYDQMLLQLTQLQSTTQQKISTKEKELQQLRNQQTERLEQAQPVIANYDGIMARLKALEQLPAAPSVFIMLLFLVIETAPIITKLLASKSEYDFRWETSETQSQKEIALAQQIFDKELQSRWQHTENGFAKTDKDDEVEQHFFAKVKDKLLRR